jgi:CHASE3 domain
MISRSATDQIRSAPIRGSRPGWFTRHLWAIVAVSFGLVLLAGILAAYIAIRATDIERSVAHTFEVRQVARSLLSDLQDAETGQRGFLLTEDKPLMAIPRNDGRIQGSPPVWHPDYGADPEGDWIADHDPSVPACRGGHLSEAPSGRLRNRPAVPGPPKHQDHDKLLLRPGNNPGEPRVRQDRQTTSEV